MTAAYYSILTNNGKASIANATISAPVGFSDIAVGDGNGSVPTPLETRTALVNEKARFACNSVALNPNNTNWIEAEIIIPTTSGGYTIRELGLYAGATLVAIANFPSTYKPLETEGGAREIAIKMVINVQNAEVISISLDNSLIYATRQWVDTYYVPRSEIIDNLTTDESKKPVSAKQAKALQDNKLDKNTNASTESAGIVKLVNDLTTGGTDKALSAEQGKILQNNKLDATQALGVSQTWKDMKASRSNNTTYTNTTGKPIQVFMAFNDTNGSGYNLTIDGIVAGGTSDLSAYLYYPFSFIVPNGSTYKMAWAGGTNTQLLFWLELR